MHIEADNPAIAGRIREYFVNMAAGKSLAWFPSSTVRDAEKGGRGRVAQAKRVSRDWGKVKRKGKKRMRTRFPASGVVRLGKVRRLSRWRRWSSAWKTRASPVGRKGVEKEGKGQGREGDEEFRSEEDVKQRRQG